MTASVLGSLGHPTQTLLLVNFITSPIPIGLTKDNGKQELMS